MSILSALRQWTYPAAFRIRPSGWPPDLVTALESFDRSRSASSAAASGLDVNPEDQVRLLAQMGTALWRLNHRMLQPGTDQPREEMAQAYRHLQSAWDALQEGGVEILAHTDSPFDAGMSLRVVAFQPVRGLDRDLIIETVKPTIYVRGKLVQAGEVIVGTPQASNEPAPADPTPTAQP